MLDLKTGSLKMTDFLKIWLNAVAASISAFAGLPYEPVRLTDTRFASTKDHSRQMSLPLDDEDEGFIGGYPGHAHAA